MKTFFVIASIMLIFANAAFPASRVPEIKKDCFICHMLDEEGTRVLLKQPINELCLGCHPDRNSPAEHKVGIRPSMRVNYLPLDDGLITCATCHEPHGLTGVFKLLRARPSKICNYCHDM